MQKAFYYTSIVAGFMYIFMAVYLAFFDTIVKPYLGSNKVYGLSVMLAVYGLFRLWRAYKTKSTLNND
ncbi:MAG: hypothetical protein RL065_894 [Bacteroidota bacterium]|jgi:hypothetical protein